MPGPAPLDRGPLAKHDVDARMMSFPGRVGIQQRVLATYRVPFFDRLATRCTGGLEVFAGEPRARELIAATDVLSKAQYVRGRNLHIGKGSSYICWQRGLLPWLRQSPLDALILSANPRLLSSHLAVRLMRSRGRPVVGWGLGAPEYSANPGPGRRLSRRVGGRFLASFDAVIAYSSKGASDYVRTGISPDRVLVAHNAVSSADAEAFLRKLSREPDLVSRWRHRLGLLNRPTIAFVGRLVPRKRVDDLIRACSALADECELLIAGDGPERAALEDLAAAIFPRVRFLGHREGQELAPVFAAADLFVLPGTGGLAVHEAMLYGKPVMVGVSDGTQADLVREGRNGFRLEPDMGVPTLERMIRLALSDPRGLQQMGLESRRIATEEVSIDAMADAFVRALLLVTGGRAPGQEVGGC